MSKLSNDRIGVALSGGGSRAIAFHLGCLRALERHGILQRVRVFSTVSGGAVIGAMYACHDGDFASFEIKVRTALQGGFFRAGLRTAFTSIQGPAALANYTLAVCVAILRRGLELGLWLLKLFNLVPRTARMDSMSVRRRFSRTTILERTFDRFLFDGKTLGSLASRPFRLITIACELRTKSAFYFSATSAGCWRYGETDANDIKVARAVAASAAYPGFLPTLDLELPFSHRGAPKISHRVSLTDGGVYDNLALAPLWPDRDPQISLGVEDLDTLIACCADDGLSQGQPAGFLPGRMIAVIGAIHARAQNATMKRLFDLKEAGRLKSFLLPYLGLNDKNLTTPPSDLVTRDDAAGYPTDFNQMPDEWIERLSRRGDQLTEALLKQYAPHLISGGGNS